MKGKQKNEDTAELEATLERSKLDVGSNVTEMLVSVENVPEFRPKVLGTDPMFIYKELEHLGEKYGAVKIIPPDDWRPPVSLDLDRLQFRVNLQRLDRMVTGNPFQHSKRIWDGRKYAAVASALYSAVAAIPPESRDLKTLEESIPQEFLHSTEESEDESSSQPPPSGSTSSSESGDHDDGAFSTLESIGHATSPKRRGVNLFLKAAQSAEADSFVQQQSLESLYWRLVESQLVPLKVVYGSDIQVCQVGSCFPLSGSLVRRSGPPSQPSWLLPTTSMAAQIRTGYSGCGGVISAKTGAPLGEGEKYSDDPFNLQNLAWTPGSLLEFAGQEVTGVTCPWLYIGMLFSSFCWHTEDNYWGACNYHHAGAAKIWYVVPSSAADQLESALRLVSRRSAARAVHGMTLQVPLPFLKRLGIPFYRVVQRTGEFIFLWPRVFHAGFNLGLNVNEACNAAPALWLPMAALAEKNYRWLRAPCVPATQLVLQAVVAGCQPDTDERVKALLPELISHVRELIHQTETWTEFSWKESCVPVKYLLVKATELRQALSDQKCSDQRAVEYVDAKLAVLQEETPILERLAALAALPCPECVACKAVCCMGVVACRHAICCPPCCMEVSGYRRRPPVKYAQVCRGCDTQILLLRFEQESLTDLIKRAAELAGIKIEEKLITGELKNKKTINVKNLPCPLIPKSKDIATNASTNILWKAIMKYVHK